MNTASRSFALFVLLVVFLAGCAPKRLDPVMVALPSHRIDYLAEVKPILERRCVVCHSCYNSPCQLKLSSFDGIARGATKKAVYNSTRLRTMEPTRLFIDAETTEQWREKDFYSVTSSESSGSLNDSVMLQLLSHKMENPVSYGDYKPEAEDLSCAENGAELSSYLEKHPNRGMPFGFPPLQQEEFDTVAGWLAQGAHGPGRAALASRKAIEPADKSDVVKWERFFNQQGAKHVMTARYLYEHFFLAHIRFRQEAESFYELVRSTTPSGEPIEVIATVRPYDYPGERFYYRFRRIHSTIVHKTHMVFTLDDKAYNRYHELFLQPAWQEKPTIMGYSERAGADPFTVFRQIPVRSRYQFLLDNAHYMVMTFIRGPVCKGQVALNVINDHFWIMFLDPEADLIVRYPAFLKLHQDKLAIPAEAGSSGRLLTALSNPYHDRAMAYHRVRGDFYMAHYYDGMDYEAIWKGEKPSDAPLLTVFRHFDSASVHKGALGDLPRTFWVLDYPLFERIYYSLVAGFDVFGNAWHQLTTRLYMDALRREAESNFLDFMPHKRRREMMQDWYRGMDFFHVRYHPTDMPTGVDYHTEEVRREFVEHLVGSHFPYQMGIRLDSLNYTAGEDYPAIPDTVESPADVLRALHAASAPGESFFTTMTDFNANVAYIRVKMKESEDIVISVVVHRWHDNVTFLFGEKNTLDASRDSADFFAGFIGSYPNYFFEVELEDVGEFARLLADFRGTVRDFEKLEKYGVNRSEEQFWQVYDWFQERFSAGNPSTAGLFDLNRYYYRATGGPSAQE